MTYQNMLMDGIYDTLMMAHNMYCMFGIKIVTPISSLILDRATQSNNCILGGHNNPISSWHTFDHRINVDNGFEYRDRQNKKIHDSNS
jgi:hypothetical protein